MAWLIVSMNKNDGHMHYISFSHWGLFSVKNINDLPSWKADLKESHNQTWGEAAVVLEEHGNNLLNMTRKRDWKIT